MRNVTLPLNNHVQFSTILSLCGKERNYTLGSSIHAATLKISHFFNHQNLTIIHNSLISMYSRCGHLPNATNVFNQMQFKDTISWNSMISGCFMNDEFKMGFQYFRRLCNSNTCSLDHATITTLLSICSKPEFRHARMMVHSLTITNGLAHVVPVGNALITCYFKCGCSDSACKVFGGMIDRNMITWTTMISGAAQMKLFEKSLHLFREMRCEEEANSLTYSSSLFACSGLRALHEGEQIHGLVVKSGFLCDLCVESALMDVYSKCGMIDNACRIFRSCRDPDEVSLTVILVGLAQNGLEERAFELFAEIVGEGIDIDANMVSAVLGAFDAFESLALGRQIHSLIIKNCLGSNVFVCNGLINMYSKCGELVDSIKAFKQMAQKNSVSWNSMIAAFARHGHGSKALELYEDMILEGTNPTDVTYISLLHACSHVGLVEKGMEFLTLMSSVHGMTPRMEHYSCVVDMLGRAGLLKEAKNFIEGLRIKPTTLLWQALLGACSIHGDSEVGKHAAEQLLLEEPDCPAAYVLLANIYSSKGMWGETARIVKDMKDMGVKKETGMSWIEVEKKVHSFVVEDKAHSEAGIIYEVLNELVALIREEDCVSDKPFLFDDLVLE